MEAVRDRWTDERLDDLNKKVDDGFADMRAEFRALRGEMRENSREMGAEISSLYRLVLGLFGTMIFGFAGLILSHV